MRLSRVDNGIECLEMYAAILSNRIPGVDDTKSFFNGVNAVFETLQELIVSDDFKNSRVEFPIEWLMEMDNFNKYLRKYYEVSTGIKNDNEW